MELVHVIRAIRRYWWATAICAVLGLAAGMFLATGQAALYRAEAMMLLRPPPGTANGGVPALERSAQNQLVVLQSDGLAQAVADEVGDMTASEVLASTSFEQLAETDIVRIIVTSTSPEESQAIANAYLASHGGFALDRERAARQPELDAIESQLADTRAQLAAIHDDIDAAIEPYRSSQESIPNIESIDSALATERDVVRTQYNTLLNSRSTLQTEISSLQVGSQFVQLAGPGIPSGRGSSLVPIAGFLGGLIIGALVAVGLARSSTTVLDADEVERLLNIPIAGSLPKDRLSDRRELLLSSPLSPSTEVAIEALCVRSEASGGTRTPLTIVVTSADKNAGATTIAAAMARRIATETRVILIDVCTSDPELSRLIGSEADGVAQFLEPDGLAHRHANGTLQTMLHSVPSPQSSLQVAGLGDHSDRVRIRREDVASLIQAAGVRADVVVVDAGRLMSSASNVQLAELADVVILAIPIKRQRSATLRVVGQELRRASGAVFPVLTPVTPSRFRSDGAMGSASVPPVDVDDQRASAKSPSLS